MSSQVLLISYVESELAPLHNHLQRNHPESIIETAVNMRQGFQKLADRPTDLVVMNFDVISDVVAKHIRNMKSVVGRVPLLVLGRVDKAAIRAEITKLHRTVILEKPFNLRDLSGLAQKVINERSVAQQVHKRYPTQQSAYFEIFGKDVASPTMLLNLSRGGAFMQLEQKEDIEIGDLLRLEVKLEQASKHHRMHARVVWTQDPAADGKAGVGVQFISATEVYREMQNR